MVPLPAAVESNKNNKSSQLTLIFHVNADILPITYNHKEIKSITNLLKSQN